MIGMTFALVALLQAAPQVPQNAPVPAAEQLVDAEARYRSAIALNPSIAAYHESLALVLERKGAMAEALAEHERAVALDSLSPRNRAGLGLLLLRMNRPKDAAVHLEAAAASDPGNAAVAAALTELGGGEIRTDGYHDLSGFADDDKSGQWIRIAIERVFAVGLGIATLALLAPILGAMLALLLEMPRQWLARRHA
jgi:tetratricopeptide (TPR) repeat protein